MKIENIDKRYGIYALPINQDGVSEILMIEESRWQYMGAAKRLAIVSVEYRGEPIAYDIRILGGGVPLGIDDYEMLDIGNVSGRPCRIGTGGIIQIPKEYEKYKDRITEAVEKYKVAADRFYIIFR